MWAWESGMLWGIDLKHLPPRVIPRLAVRFGEVSDSEVAALSTAMRLDQTVVRHRLATGRRAFVAWFEHKIVAFGWLSQQPEYIGEQEREIQISLDQAYIWDCVTLSSYRGQRLYSALLSHMLAALRQEGVRRVWIGSSVSNQPSLRGFASAGFLPLITLTHVRVWRLRVLWIKEHPGSPRELIAAARHVLLRADERPRGSIALRWSRT